MLQGVIRWCLMCAVQCAQDCHLPLPSTTTEKEKDRDREKEKEKKSITSSSTSTSTSSSSSTISRKSDRSHAANDVEKKVEKSTPDSWQMHLYTSTDIVNDEDTSDPFLASVCAVLKCAALSEILRKDLEMIANVVLFTISSEEKNTKIRYSSTKKSLDNYGKLIDNVVSGSSARVVEGAGVGAGGVDGAGVSVGVGVEESDRDRDRERELKLSPLAMLRVYLLRLLFVTYEEHISTVIGTGVSTVLRRPKAYSNSDSNQVCCCHCHLLNSI